MTTRRDIPFEFTWIDAFCPEDQWYHRDEFVLTKRIMKTIGWVLAQDRDYMVVAGTYDEEADIFAQVLCIPRGCIQKVREVSDFVLGKSGGGSGDPGGDVDSDPIDSEGEKPMEVLPSLVGVPDPGGFDLEVAYRTVARPLTPTRPCGCRCHDPMYAGHVHHLTSCCENADEVLDKTG